VVPANQSYDRISADLLFASVQSAFPNSRNQCPDAGQTVGEQQFLLRFPQQLCRKRVCVNDGPGFAQGRTDTRVLRINGYKGTVRVLATS